VKSARHDVRVWRGSTHGCSSCEKVPCKVPAACGIYEDESETTAPFFRYLLVAIGIVAVLVIGLHFVLRAAA